MLIGRCMCTEVSVCSGDRGVGCGSDREGIVLACVDKGIGGVQREGVIVMDLKLGGTR